MYELSRASSGLCSKLTKCRHICKETMGTTHSPSLCCIIMPASLHPGLPVSELFLSNASYLYLQAKVLHPFLYGGGYCSLGLTQGLWALLTASQQTRVTGNVQSSSCDGHLGGQSDNERTETVRPWTMFTHPWIHVTITDLTLYYLTSVLWCKDMNTYCGLAKIFSDLFTLRYNG